MTVLKLSVRDLAKFAYRHGGLKYDADHSESDDTPNSLHSQLISSAMKNDTQADHLSECWLKNSCEIGNIRFEIRGRADLISVFPDKMLRIIEIKTIIDETGHLPSEADIMHIAQARLYAYMYCLETGEHYNQIAIIVRYILSPAYAMRDFTELTSFGDLEQFFRNTLEMIYDFTRSLKDYRALRDSSIKSMKFPYSELRQGQKDLMGAVLDSIRDKDPLYAQAPTGTGKTISVLYPAIKSIPSNYSDYIFYLTAKTSTQNIACEALDDMRKNGLVARSIRLTAKEKLCPCKEIYCDMEQCRYAVDYYNNSRSAMKELFTADRIDADILLDIAEKYYVCPFEIGLDVSMFCDVIICDYNYVFDPRIRLARFFNEDIYKHVLLIDEAHNLPPRSNEMFSSSLSADMFRKIGELNPYLSESLKASIAKLAGYFSKASEFLTADPEESNRTPHNGNIPRTFDRKIESTAVVKTDGICASRKPPAELLGLCDKFISETKPVLDRMKRHDIKKVLLDVYFEIRFFSKVGWEFYNDDYITLLSFEKDLLLIRIKCLNASDKLTSFYNGKNSVIYFSATMSPQEYFIPLFSGKPGAYDLKRKILPSPFPPENLWVGIVSAISTKFKERPYTLEDVVSVIYTAISAKKGNYIVYCPSFEYQRMIMDAFKSYLRGITHSNKKNITIIGQSRGMSESERNLFLDSFFAARKETLVGFAVLGGVFGEGIDLTGESLSGVVLVGVGLPAKSFEQDILMDYFENAFGKGFDYAYKYPGFNKILQAAGRVIRTDTDRGFILLVDERYSREDYKQLFPEEWDPVYVGSKEDIDSGLREFFGE